LVESDSALAVHPRDQPNLLGLPVQRRGTWCLGTPRGPIPSQGRRTIGVRSCPPRGRPVVRASAARRRGDETDPAWMAGLVADVLRRHSHVVWRRVIRPHPGWGRHLGTSAGEIQHPPGDPQRPEAVPPQREDPRTTDLLARPGGAGTGRDSAAAAPGRSRKWAR